MTFLRTKYFSIDTSGIYEIAISSSRFAARWHAYNIPSSYVSINNRPMTLMDAYISLQTREFMVIEVVLVMKMMKVTSSVRSTRQGAVKAENEVETRQA